VRRLAAVFAALAATFAALAPASAATTAPALSDSSCCSLTLTVPDDDPQAGLNLWPGELTVRIGAIVDASFTGGKVYAKTRAFGDSDAWSPCAASPGSSRGTALYFPGGGAVAAGPLTLAGARQLTARGPFLAGNDQVCAWLIDRSGRVVTTTGASTYVGWDPTDSACWALPWSEVAKAIEVPAVIDDNQIGNYTLEFNATLAWENANMSVCVWQQPAGEAAPVAGLTLIREQSTISLKRLSADELGNYETGHACEPVAGVGAHACWVLSVTYSQGFAAGGGYSGTELFAVQGHLGVYLILIVPDGDKKTDPPERLLGQEEKLARQLFAQIPFAHQ